MASATLVVTLEGLKIYNAQQVVTARGIDRVLVVDTPSGFNSAGGIAAVQSASNLRQAKSGSKTELSAQPPSFAFAFAGGEQSATLSPQAYKALDSTGFEFVSDPSMSSFSSTVVLEAATLANASYYAINSADAAIAYTSDLGAGGEAGSQEAESLQQALASTPLFNGRGASATPLKVSPQVSFGAAPTLSISGGGVAGSGVLSDLKGTVKVNLTASEFAELAAAKASNRAEIKLQDSANLSVGQQTDPITAAGVPLSSVMNTEATPSADLQALMKDLGELSFAPPSVYAEDASGNRITDASGNPSPNSIALSNEQLSDAFDNDARYFDWFASGESSANQIGKYIFTGPVVLTPQEFRALPLEGVASQDSVTLRGTAAELTLVLEEAQRQGARKINSLNFIDIEGGGDLVVNAETFAALDQAQGQSSLDSQEGLMGVSGDIVITSSTSTTASANFATLRNLSITRFDDSSTSDVNEQDILNDSSSAARGVSLLNNLDAIEVGVNLSSWATNTFERASADRLQADLQSQGAELRLVDTGTTSSLSNIDQFLTILDDQAGYNLQIANNSIDLSDFGRVSNNGQFVYELQRLIEGTEERPPLTSAELSKLGQLNGAAGSVALSADRLEEVLTSGLQPQRRLFTVEDSIAELKSLVVAANGQSAGFNLNGVSQLSIADGEPADAQLVLTAAEYDLLRAEQAAGLSLPTRAIKIEDTSANLDAFFERAFAGSNGALTTGYNLSALDTVETTDGELISLSVGQLRAVNRERSLGLDLPAESFKVVDTQSAIDSLVDTAAFASTAFSTSDLTLVRQFSTDADADYFPELTTSQVRSFNTYLESTPANAESHQRRELADGLLNVQGTTDELGALIFDATDSTPLDLAFVHRIIGGGIESETIELSYQQFKALRTGLDEGGASLTNLNPFDGLVNLELVVMGTAAELQDLFDLYEADFSNLEASISFRITDGEEVRLSAVQLDKLDGRIEGAVVVADSAENLGDVFDSAIAGVVKDFEVVDGQDSQGNDILVDADDATLTLTVNELGGLPGYVNADVVLRDSDDQLQRVLRADLDYRVSRIETDASKGDGRDGNLSLDLRIGQLERLLENGVEIADNIIIVLDSRDTLELNAKSAGSLPNGFVGSLVIEDDGQSLVDLFSGVWNLPENATEVIFRSLDNAPIKLTVQQLQQAVAPYPGFSGEIILEDSINELSNYFASNTQETTGQLMRIATVVASDLGFSIDPSADLLSLSTDEFNQLQDAEAAIGRELFDGRIVLDDASAPAVAAFDDTRLQFSVAQQVTGQAVGEVNIEQFLEQVKNPTTPSDFNFDVVDSPALIREFLETADAETVPLLSRIDSFSGHYDSELTLSLAALEQLPAGVSIESLVLEVNQADLDNTWDAQNTQFILGERTPDSIAFQRTGISPDPIALSIEQYNAIEALLGDTEILLAGAPDALKAQIDATFDPRIVELKPVNANGDAIGLTVAFNEFYNLPGPWSVQGGVAVELNSDELKTLILDPLFEPNAIKSFQGRDGEPLVMDSESLWTISSSTTFPSGLAIRDTATDLAGLIGIDGADAFDGRITDLQIVDSDRLSLSIKQVQALDGVELNGVQNIVVSDSVDNIKAALGLVTDQSGEVTGSTLDQRIQAFDLLNGSAITLNASQVHSLRLAENGSEFLANSINLVGEAGENQLIAELLDEFDSRLVSLSTANGEIRLNAAQVANLPESFAGSIQLVDAAAGVEALLARPLDRRITSVEVGLVDLASALSVEDQTVEINAQQLIDLPNFVDGRFKLVDTLQNIESLIQAPVNLSSTMTLELSVAQLDVLVQDSLESSLITGDALLDVTGLDQQSINVHSQVFRNLPSQLNVNVSLADDAAIELGQAWPEFLAASEGGVDTITINAGSSVSADSNLISTDLAAVAIAGHGDIILTNYSEGQDVSAIDQDLNLSVVTKGGSGDFNISFLDKGLLSNSNVSGVNTFETSFEATLGDYPAPVFADLNQDGKLDLIVGDEDGDIWYYENQSSTGFDFKAVVNGEDIGLSLYEDRYLDDREGDYYASPAFADLDGDGDLDAFVGDVLGDINYFENVSDRAGDGLITTLDFASPVSAGIFGVTGMIVDGDQVANEEQRSAIGQQPVAWNAMPAFTDLDGDGDLDLFVGSYYDGLRYFENISDASGIQFADGVDASVFGIRPVDSYTAPVFADVNNDGLVDLVIGNDNGHLNLWLNESTEGNVRFKFSDEVVDIGNYSRPAFADIDGDGDLDLVVGGYNDYDYDELIFVENTSTYASSEQELSLAQLQASGGLKDAGDNLILSNPQTSIHEVSAVDAFELQNYIRPDGGSPQDASIRVVNYLSDSNADIKSLQDSVARVEVVVEGQTNGSNTVLRRQDLPDQTEFVLKNATTVELNADDAEYFIDQFRDASDEGSRSTVRVKGFSGQNLRATSGKHIENEELKLVVELQSDSIIDLAGGPNVLAQADDIVITDGSQLTMSESQITELIGEAAGNNVDRVFTIASDDFAAEKTSLLVKGYTGADLKNIFSAGGPLGGDDANKVKVTYELDANADFSSMGSGLIEQYLEDADCLDLNGFELKLNADQTEALKAKLVNLNTTDLSSIVVVGFDGSQDLTLPVESGLNQAGFGDRITLRVNAESNTDISGFANADNGNNPLNGLFDSEAGQRDLADVIEVGGDDVFTLDMAQADELQNNIRGLTPVGPGAKGKIFVENYDGTDLADLLPTDLESAAADQLDITFNVSSTSSFTSQGGLVAKVADADVINVEAGATLTLTAAEADALSGKLTGPGKLVITDYNNEILNDLVDTFADVTLLITEPEGEVSFKDVDIIDVVNTTGVQSIELQDNAQMHALQYSGINLGQYIKKGAERGVDSIARVTVSDDIAINQDDSSVYFDGINQVLIDAAGRLSIDNGSQSDSVLITPESFTALADGESFTVEFVASGSTDVLETFTSIAKGVSVTADSLASDLAAKIAAVSGYQAVASNGEITITGPSAQSYVVEASTTADTTPPSVLNINQLDYQFVDLVSKLDSASAGTLNIVNVSPETQIPSLLATATNLAVDVTLTNGLDANSRYSVDFQAATNLAGVSNVYIPEFAELVLSFEQAVSDLSRSGGPLPLQELNGDDFETDIAAFKDDEYQFEFIKALPNLDTSDPADKLQPGILRLDMSRYQDFDVPLLNPDTGELFTSSARQNLLSDEVDALIKSQYGEAETEATVRSKLQKVGLKGLLARQEQGVEDFQLALGIPAGVEIPIEGRDLTLFHNNVVGEGDSNKGILRVTNYKGEDISGVGNTLSAIKVEIDDTKVVIDESTQTKLPVITAGPVELIVNDGASLTYAKTGTSDLSQYSISMKGQSRLAVDSAQLADFASRSFESVGGVEPVLELLGYTASDNGPISGALASSGPVKLHAVIGSVMDRSGDMPADSGETVALGADTADLNGIDAITVAEGSILTIHDSLSSLDASIDAVFGTLVVDSKLVDNKSITQQTDLIADVASNAVATGTITVRELDRADVLSGIEAGYNLRAEVSSAEATGYIAPVSEVQSIAVEVHATSSYFLNTGVMGGSGEISMITDDSPTLTEIVDGLKAAAGYGDLPYTISEGTNSILLTYKQSGPQDESPRLTWDRTTFHAPIEVTPGVAEVSSDNAAFNFKSSGFSTIDVFEVQDDDNTINATAAELDGITLIAKSSETPSIDVSDYDNQDLSRLASDFVVAVTTSSTGAQLEAAKLSSADSIDVEAVADGSAIDVKNLTDQVGADQLTVKATGSLTVAHYVDEDLSDIAVVSGGDLNIETMIFDPDSQASAATLNSNFLVDATSVVLKDSAIATADSAEALASRLSLEGERLDVSDYADQDISAIDRSEAGSELVITTGANAKLVQSNIIGNSDDLASGKTKIVIGDTGNTSSGFDMKSGLHNITVLDGNILTVESYSGGDLSGVDVSVENSRLVVKTAPDLTIGSAIEVNAGANETNSGDADAAAKVLTFALSGYEAGDELSIQIDANTAVTYEVNGTENDLAAAVAAALGSDNGVTFSSATADVLTLTGSKTSAAFTDFAATLTAIQNTTPTALNAADLSKAAVVKLTGEATVDETNAAGLLAGAQLETGGFDIRGQKLSVTDYTGADLSAIQSGDSHQMLVETVAGNTAATAANLVNAHLADATSINLRGFAAANAAELSLLLDNTDGAAAINLNGNELIVSDYVSQSLQAIDSSTGGAGSMTVTTASTDAPFVIGTEVVEQAPANETNSGDADAAAKILSFALSGYEAGDELSIKIDANTAVTYEVKGTETDLAAAVAAALGSNNGVTFSSSSPDVLILTGSATSATFTDFSANLSVTEAAVNLVAANLDDATSVALGGSAQVAAADAATLANRLKLDGQRLDVSGYVAQDISAIDRSAPGSELVITTGASADLSLGNVLSGDAADQAVQLARTSFELAAVANSTGYDMVNGLAGRTTVNDQVLNIAGYTGGDLSGLTTDATSDVRVTTAATALTASAVLEGVTDRGVMDDRVGGTLPVQKTLTITNFEAGDVLKVRIGATSNSTATYTVTGAEADINEIAANFAAAINYHYGSDGAGAADGVPVTAAAATNVITFTGATVGVPETHNFVLNSSDNNTDGVISTFFDEFSGTQLDDVHLLDVKQLTLGGEATISAADAVAVLDTSTSGTTRTGFVISGQQLNVTDYVQQNLSAIDSGTSSGHSMVVTTSSTELATLDETYLADATSIQIGDGDATVSAASIVNFFTTVGISADEIKSASTTDDANKLTVTGYTGQDISDLADGLNLEVQVGSGSTVTLTNSNIGAVETISLADGTAATMTAAEFKLLNDAGASFSGTGDLEITGYSADSGGNDSSASEADEDITLANGLASTLNISVAIASSDEAAFSASKFSSGVFGAGDSLTIDGDLTGSVDELLAFVAGSAELRGSGTLKLTGYTGQDLTPLLTALSGETNTLNVELTTSGAVTLSKELLVGASGDLDRIKKIFVPDGSTTTLTAALATSAAGSEKFTQRFFEVTGGSGTIEIEALGDTHDLSDFVPDNATDDLTINVISTDATINLTNAKLDKVDSIQVSASAVASIAQSEISAFTTSGRTLLGTAGESGVSETSILTVTGADGTVALPTLSNLNANVEMSGDVTLSDGNFDVADVISMTTNNTFSVKAGTDLQATQFDLAANGSSMIVDQGVIPPSLTTLKSSQADKAVITVDQVFQVNDFIEISIDNGPVVLVTVTGADTAAADIKAALEANSDYAGMFMVESGTSGSNDTLTITSSIGRAFNVSLDNLSTSGSATVSNDQKSVMFGTTSDGSSNQVDQLFNLKNIETVKGVDEVKINLDDGNSTNSSTGHVRISSALSQNNNVSVVLDSTDNDTVEDVFIEVEDRIAAVTGTTVSATVLTGNTDIVSNAWEDHGHGMVNIKNFKMGVDTLNFINPSGLSAFDPATFSSAESAGLSNGAFMMTQQTATLTDISSVRSKIASFVTSVGAGDEFAISLFGKTGTQWDVGVFKVKWNDADDTTNLTNVANMEVTPLAKITDINTDDWDNFFSTPDAIPNDNIVTRRALI